MAKNNKFYETRSFKKLNDEWSRKLEQSGFEDIEQPTNFKSGLPDGNLKQWASSFFIANFRDGDVDKFKAKEEYYRLAGQFLHEYKFSNEYEKNVWEMHGEGLSIETIVNTLLAKKVRYILGRKVNIRFISEMVRRLYKIMLEKLKK